MLTTSANTDWAPNTTFIEGALLLSIIPMLRKPPNEIGNHYYPHFPDGQAETERS